MIYKSKTGRTVNAGSYVVSVTGMYTDVKIAELDLLVGDTLELVDDAYVEPVVVPVKSPVLSTPKSKSVAVETAVE